MMNLISPPFTATHITFGSLGYANLFRSGLGDHPLLFHNENGAILSALTVENTLSDPLFPSLP